MNDAGLPDPKKYTAKLLLPNADDIPSIVENCNAMLFRYYARDVLQEAVRRFKENTFGPDHEGLFDDGVGCCVLHAEKIIEDLQKGR